MKTLKLSDRRLGIFFLHCGEESFSSLSFLRVPPLFSVFGSSTFSSPQFCISIKHTRGSSPQLSSSRTQSETRTVCLFFIDLQPDRSNSVCGSFLPLMFFTTQTWVSFLFSCHRWATQTFCRHSYFQLLTILPQWKLPLFLTLADFHARCPLWHDAHRISVSWVLWFTFA